MVAKKFIYGVTGCVYRYISADDVEIDFKLEGKVEKALLKRDKFYYNAKVLPRHERLHSFLSNGTEVKFSCQKVVPTTMQGHKWIVTMCWQIDDTPGRDIEVSIGMVYVMGKIITLEKHHGILIMNDTSGNEHKVHFMAHNVYVMGKRLSASKLLTEEFNIDDEVFFDAVPCIQSEDLYNCKWFATCVFKGKRPLLFDDSSIPEEPTVSKVPLLLQTIRSYTSNSRTMFISGVGIMLSTFNKSFGIILAKFQYNLYQPIIFHKENASLFKTSLAKSDLSKVLEEGDRVKFVAVGAPPDFVTEWIAVQVAVCGNGEYPMPKFDEDTPKPENRIKHEANKLLKLLL